MSPLLTPTTDTSTSDINLQVSEKVVEVTAVVNDNDVISGETWNYEVNDDGLLGREGVDPPHLQEGCSVIGDLETGVSTTVNNKRMEYASFSNCDIKHVDNNSMVAAARAVAETEQLNNPNINNNPNNPKPTEIKYEYIPPSRRKKTRPFDFINRICCESTGFAKYYIGKQKQIISPLTLSLSLFLSQFSLSYPFAKLSLHFLFNR